jgi:DNA adenine methylase
VEPFAGGAGVALQLLTADLVEGIVLGEGDPLVAGFWKTVFREPEWLIEKVKRTPVTVAKWQHFKKAEPRSHRERALACLFLNRTSFSGILADTAGPIGGLGQESKYKIDCRFPRETVERRIRQAAELKDQVVLVMHARWAETIRRVKELDYKDQEVFYYLDPPFFAKAHRLYRYHFDEADHKDLHDAITNLKSPWLLSYDPAKTIIDRYSHNGRGPKRIDLLYSAAADAGPSEVQELIITNLPRLPRATRLWRSSREWRSPTRPSLGKGKKRQSAPRRVNGR